ncbi:MAG: SMP-30/gluconolactonase/LRE family protein [Verrucomicrobiota bacterium]
MLNRFGMVTLKSILLSIIFAFIVGCGEPSSLIKPGAEIQTIGTGYRFTEGPAWGPDQKLYFSDIPNNQIWVWNPGTPPKIFLEPSGRSNGLYFDGQGQLLACQGGARNVSRIKEGSKLEILAKLFKDKRFNSPNDLWVHPNGDIYFTDPRYGKRDSMEMQTEGVYLLKPNGLILRVVDDMVRPNGIIGSPDGATLYITDPGAKKTWRFSTAQDGSLNDKELFVERGSDGMTLDKKGNLYITQGVVAIYQPNGQLREEIQFPQKPSNITFGGPHNETIFVTARTGVYSLKMRVRGAHRN